MEPQPQTSVVALRGEHDLFRAPALRDRLEALICEGLAVVVDLRDATFLDSATVGVLLEAHREAARRGQRFALVVGDSTGWPVRRMLEVTGLVDVFAIAETMEEALAAPPVAAA